MARMELEVFLPIDRKLPGFLRLYDKRASRLLYDIPCRAKADSKLASEKFNPGRLTTQPYGDLPSGRYVETVIEHYLPSHKTFGPDAIRLEGVTGDALEALENGRTGLAIHGNRGNIELMATYGCLRVFNRDMALLVEAIGDSTVEIEVFDCTIWPPLLCPTADFIQGETSDQL